MVSQRADSCFLMRRSKRPLLCSLYLIIAFCNRGCLCQEIGSDPEAELISYLKNNITGFSPLMRPCRNASKVLFIDMDITVSQLVTVDSAKQSIKISALTLATWQEERLVWNPARFGNISTVKWSPDDVWFPLVILYNGIGDNQVLEKHLPVHLSHVPPNATYVTATWRNDYEFSCQFDMSKFPLDQHSCELLFYLSDEGHGNRLVQPRRSSLPFNVLGTYQPNSEWTMLNASAWSENKLFKVFESLPPIPLPTFILRIEIKRVPTYYFVNVITPLLLLTLLQVLVYFVPLESGEKLGFGITIMLSYTVFLLLLDGILPKSQATPAIASFITAAMILSTISLLLTSLIMRFHFAPEGARMPACARALLVRFLGRLFCVSGASAPRVSQAPNDGGSEVSVRKTGGEEAPTVGSDWVVAAHAMERLMVALGVVATVAIVGVFVIKPYASD